MGLDYLDNSWLIVMSSQLLWSNLSWKEPFCRWNDRFQRSKLTEGTISQLLGKNQPQPKSYKGRPHGGFHKPVLRNFEGEELLHFRSSKNISKQLNSKQEKIICINHLFILYLMLICIFVFGLYLFIMNKCCKRFYAFGRYLIRRKYSRASSGC